MEARSGPNHDNKIALQVSFNPTAANIILLLMCIENYFFIGPRIMFRGIANLFLDLQCFAGLAVRVFDFLGRPFVEERFQRECHGETLSGKETKEVFIFLTKSVRSQ